jgi:hypothetical protein
MTIIGMKKNGLWAVSVNGKIGYWTSFRQALRLAGMKAGAR